MAYSDDLKHNAKCLYLRKYTAGEIKERLNINSVRVVYNWIKAGDWESMVAYESIEEGAARRINNLMERENKTDQEMKELELLIKQFANRQPIDVENHPEIARLRNEKPTTSNRNSKKRNNKKKPKNDISEITEEMFQEKFHKKLYWHQKVLLENKHQRTRNLLKGRQEGATWYFAGEAFEDAVLNGDPQIFLSASRAQSEVFLAYIRAMAKDWFDIELKGSPMELSNGAILRPLSTNSNTAQSYSGHVYIDEYFWIPKFDIFNKVASAMATHKKWRKTYFSTPSSKQHLAYNFWAAKTYKKENPEEEFPSFDEMRDSGRLCPDGQWRFICTIEDAVKHGFDLVDLKELKQEYSTEDYENLFMCKFMDSSESAFAMKDIERAMVDSLEKWNDYFPDEKHPYAQHPTWLGYDPSRTTDNATCAVVAPPIGDQGKFRLLEKYSWRGVSFEFQAKQIEKLTKRFKVEYIGIDATGIGYGVYENVTAFYRRATAITYSVETKNKMVEKGKDVFKSGRFEFDQEHKDVAQSLLMIKRKVTPSGMVTYASNRTESTGHADIGWSILHALINEPMNHSKRRKSTW